MRDVIVSVCMLAGFAGALLFGSWFSDNTKYEAGCLYYTIGIPLGALLGGIFAFGFVELFGID